MRVTCKHCGRAHPSYECKYRDTNTAGAKALGPDQVSPVMGTVKSSTGSAALLGESHDNSGSTPDKGNAGSIPAPVDTNPESSVETLDSSIHGTPFTPSAGTGEDKDRQPKFDKVAYQRDYMRKWRAARGKPA